MAYLTAGPIDPAEILTGVSAPDLGGVSLFVGTVRRTEADGPVEAIEYSAYDEMAEAELGRIVREAAVRWPGVRVDLRHRVGRVELGESSVVVAAAAPHRAEAFGACRFVIEELKRRAPIWKREFHEGGATRWRENVESQGAAPESALGGRGGGES